MCIYQVYHCAMVVLNLELYITSIQGIKKARQGGWMEAAGNIDFLASASGRQHQTLSPVSHLDHLGALFCSLLRPIISAH